MTSLRLLSTLILGTQPGATMLLRYDRTHLFFSFHVRHYFTIMSSGEFILEGGVLISSIRLAGLVF